MDSVSENALILANFANTGIYYIPVLTLMQFSCVDWKKKNARESCELSFIEVEMRTLARAASQVALRNCSREVGKVGVYVI